MMASSGLGMYAGSDSCSRKDCRSGYVQYSRPGSNLRENNMMKKTAFAAPLLGSLLLLAACSQQTPSNTAPSENLANPATPTAPDVAPPAPATSPTEPPSAAVLPPPPAPAMKKKPVSRPRPAPEAETPVVAATPAPPPPPPVCSDCGVITAINFIKADAEKGSGIGAVAGGLAGIVLGNQIGGGNGKKLAQVAGAAGGAYLGNKAEKKIRATKTWEVHVKMDTGSEQIVTLTTEPTLGVGASVRVVDGNVVAK